MKNLVLASIALMVVSFNSFAGVDKGSADEQRAALQAAGEAALEQLYQENPSTRDKVSKATGYAVFPGGESTDSHGYTTGILHNNHGSKDLYMKMVSPDGMNSSVVLIFHTAKALNNFKDVGWDFSGQLNSNADSALTGVGVSGAQSVMPGTDVYQFDDAGISDNPSLQGIKFMMDEKLN